MRLGQVPLELDRAPDVIDRPRQERRVGLVARARHLVLPEPRVAEADVRERVTRIERDRALEVRDRAGDQRAVERLEPNAALGERLVGLEADGFAVRAPRRRTGSASPASRRTARRSGPAARRPARARRPPWRRRAPHPMRIDDARGDAQTIARALEAADDSKIEMQLGSERRQVGAASADSFDDPHAIDDAERAGRAQIVGDGLGNAG